jgi:hypothetical protein
LETDTDRNLVPIRKPYPQSRKIDLAQAAGPSDPAHTFLVWVAQPERSFGKSGWLSQPELTIESPEQSKSPSKRRGLCLSGLLDFLTLQPSSDSSLMGPIGVDRMGQENAGAEQCHQCRRELQHGNHSYTARWYFLKSINAQRFRMVSSPLENGFVLVPSWRQS